MKSQFWLLFYDCNAIVLENFRDLLKSYLKFQQKFSNFKFLVLFKLCSKLWSDVCGRLINIIVKKNIARIFSYQQNWRNVRNFLQIAKTICQPTKLSLHLFQLQKIKYSNDLRDLTNEIKEIYWILCLTFGLNSLKSGARSTTASHSNSKN